MLGTPREVSPGTAARQFGRTQSPRRVPGTVGISPPATAMPTLPTTGPRRNLTFDTTGRTQLPLQRVSTSPTGGPSFDESMMRDTTPLADRLFEQTKLEEAERTALEEELLVGIKEDLRRLAVKLDAEDWMYPNKPALPFKM